LLGGRTGGQYGAGAGGKYCENRVSGLYGSKLWATAAWAFACTTREAGTVPTVTYEMGAPGTVGINAVCLLVVTTLIVELAAQGAITLVVTKREGQVSAVIRTDSGAAATFVTTGGVYPTLRKLYTGPNPHCL
jgi:hypothetical protein